MKAAAAAAVLYHAQLVHSLSEAAEGLSHPGLPLAGCPAHSIHCAPFAPPPQPQHSLAATGAACVPPDFTHLMLLLSFLHSGGPLAPPHSGARHFCSVRVPPDVQGPGPIPHSTMLPLHPQTVPLLCAAWCKNQTLPLLLAVSGLSSISSPTPASLANEVAHCGERAVDGLDGLPEGLCGGACRGGRGVVWRAQGLAPLPTHPKLLL